ncbi:MAG: RtcB family protein [Clostridiales bacterium]|jgi:tRNA-splicing ligase RtcB|nr:RtcB family protein [Clostridiales bacterium]
MRTIKTEGLDILCWAMEAEEGALSQARNIAMLPFAHHHIALMPDTHQGFGMPIGGVMAAIGHIVPNAVGVDIGCGVLASRTSLKEISREDLKRVLGAVRKAIPMGFKHRDKPLEIEPPPQGARIVQQEHKSARRQVGTLGGGNHFIEVQKGDDGFIWFMVHSGSRNLGKKVCDHYNALAKETMNSGKGFIVPKAWDLAYLNADAEGGRGYIIEMEYCQRFAKLNREIMSQVIAEIFEDVTGANVLESHNVHHNYARREFHYGKDTWVHRKGATSAKAGEIGIIPGSQGTKSYIVKGRGNPLSFESCSHGAGRVMGRKQAQRTLSLEQEIERLEAKGILHGLRGVRDLDEAASAYKCIDIVMEEQKDLVDIHIELTPLGVIKG